MKLKPFKEMTQQEYYDFLWSYTTFDKSKDELIRDLELDAKEQKILDEALAYYRSRVEVHKKEGRPSPTYAFYIMEYIDEELDEGIPRELMRRIVKEADDEQ